MKKSIFFIVLGICLIELVVIFALLKKNKSEQIAAEKTEQMYYEEIFSQPKMNLFARNPTIIIPPTMKSLF